MARRAAVLVITAVLAGCSIEASGLRELASSRDGGGMDARVGDGGRRRDAAGDARAPDAGTPDAGSRDAGPSCTSTTCSMLCDPATGACVDCIADDDCPAPEATAWTDCDFPTHCAETGTQTRTVTVHACMDGACVPARSEESMACTRETDGVGCGDDGSYCTNDVCTDGACRHPCKPRCTCAGPGICACSL